MTDQQLYCDGPGRDPGTECHLPVAGHGKGKCQAHLKQMQRVGKLSPIAEKLSAEERSLVAHDAWLKAGDSDEEYEVRRRAALAAAKQLGKKETCEAIRKAMAEARTRGVRLGRPPKVDPAEIKRLFVVLKSVSLVAQVLGVHRNTVTRRQKAHAAKQANAAKSTITGHGTTGRPRSGE